MDLEFFKKTTLKPTKTLKLLVFALFLVGCATNLNENEKTNYGILKTEQYKSYTAYNNYQEIVKDLFNQRLNELNHSFGLNKTVNLKFSSNSLAAVEEDTVYIRDSLLEHRVYCNNDCPVKHLTKNSQKEKLVKELNAYSQKHNNVALTKKEFGKMLIDLTVSHELGHIFYPEVSVKTPLNALPFYVKNSNIKGDIAYGSNIYGIANEFFAEAVGLKMLKEHYPTDLFNSFLEKRAIIRTANTLWELSDVDTAGHKEHLYKVLFDNIDVFLNANSYQELAELSFKYAVKAYKEIGVIVLDTNFNSQDELNWYLADYTTKMNVKITYVACGVKTDCLKITGLNSTDAYNARSNPDYLKQQIFNEITQWRLESHY